MSNKYYKILSQLLNKLIKDGKKSIALKYFFLFLKDINRHSEQLLIPSSIFLSRALNNIRPVLSVQKFWKGRKVFYLPKLISREQEIKIALKWLIKSSNNRKEKKLNQRLTNEILDCYKGTGSTLSKKQNLYDMIIESRPFLNLLIYK